jgi:hypothetical protein
MTIECPKTRTLLALQLPTSVGSDWLAGVRLPFFARTFSRISHPTGFASDLLLNLDFAQTFRLPNSVERAILASEFSLIATDHP